jgi:uncharacterized protein (TIGR03032 family)
MSIDWNVLRSLWREHDRRFRDPAQISGHWPLASSVDSRLLRATADPGWRRVLRRLDVTLLVTREYEHLVMAIPPRAETTWLPLPHPSGIAVDRRRRRVHIASTRNPNVVFELAPVAGFLRRGEAKPPRRLEGVLVPARSRFLPGCTYLHDLAIIDGVLYGASTGQNAIVRLDYDRGMRPVWWPRSVERLGGARLSRNHLQLNSIAAGRSLATSFFSASSAVVGPRVPGEPDYPVDGRGVLFSGASREPIVAGLTRPHSARIHRGDLWVDNSGYGELCRVRKGRCEPVARLPGWTRGLCLVENVAFVGTSRVIPGFERYAPGVDPKASVCGVHAVDLRSGRTLGSLIWPYGHQIFAVEAIPRRWSPGFPFTGSGDSPEEIRRLFYSFALATN